MTSRWRTDKPYLLLQIREKEALPWFSSLRSQQNFDLRYPVTGPLAACPLSLQRVLGMKLGSDE
jgi:hypothetical protein